MRKFTAAALNIIGFVLLQATERFAFQFRYIAPKFGLYLAAVMYAFSYLKHNRRVGYYTHITALRRCDTEYHHKLD